MSFDVLGIYIFSSLKPVPLNATSWCFNHCNWARHVFARGATSTSFWSKATILVVPRFAGWTATGFPVPCWLFYPQFWLLKNIYRNPYRRKFRSETSDNMDSWKAEVRRVRREKIRRKKMQMREKVGKSRNTVFFQWFGAPEGRKVGSLKRRVRSQLARWEMKNCTPLWREAHFEVKINVQNTPAPDHFWKLRCWKSARRCGAKHISKSKCTKHTILAPLLEVEMSKKCTPLWREAHFEVKMYKTHQLRTTFGSWDVEKVHAVVARSTFPSQNVQNTPCSDHFWRFRCRKSARRCGAKHILKSKV